MFVPLPRFKDKIKDCIIGTKLNMTIIIDAGITNVHPIIPYPFMYEMRISSCMKYTSRTS